MISPRRLLIPGQSTRDAPAVLLRQDSKGAAAPHFKLVNAAAKTWRRLKGENQLPKVVQGIKFQNGIEVIKMSAHHAA